jgi:coenzyme F420-reducing hydrogenase delta subunit
MAYEPKLLGILCHWCSYSASDAAGAARLALPANLRTLRVMCTGRVDPTFVVEALQRGADGVLICGCHIGDCHYTSGNRRALGRLRLLERLLTGLGLEPGRLRLEWISASESERYAQVAGEMTEALRQMGPLRWPSLDEAATKEARDG